jgi:hypothetical protein
VGVVLFVLLLPKLALDLDHRPELVQARLALSMAVLELALVARELVLERPELPVLEARLQAAGETR